MLAFYLSAKEAQSELQTCLFSKTRGQIEIVQIEIEFHMKAPVGGGGGSIFSSHVGLYLASTIYPK